MLWFTVCSQEIVYLAPASKKKFSNNFVKSTPGITGNMKNLRRLYKFPIETSFHPRRVFKSDNFKTS